VILLDTYDKLDAVDESIISLLKLDGSLSTSAISKKILVPITTVHNRIKKMVDSGIIKNYTIVPDYEKIGKSLTAYILITVNQNVVGPNHTTHKKISQEDIARKVKGIFGADTVDIVTGSTDLIVKVRAKNTHDLNNLLTHKLREVEGVDKTQTMIVLEEI
jgi:DNA-binding Lrp family transcriptional regulator